MYFSQDNTHNYLSNEKHKQRRSQYHLKIPLPGGTEVFTSVKIIRHLELNISSSNEIGFIIWQESVVSQD